MRNKYSKDFEEEMYKKASNKTIEQLLNIAINKYNYSITKDMLRQYLSKRKIRYKNYKYNKVRKMGRDIAIGTEYVKPDGMTLIKVAPDKWKYKQRVIYEQCHNVKLKSDDYIIFLDQDRTNFDINNLRLIKRKESAIMGNQNIFSKNPIATETGIIIAKLMNKVKEIK